MLENDYSNNTKIIKIWNNIIIITRAVIILRHIYKSMNINKRSTIIITIEIKSRWGKE